MKVFAAIAEKLESVKNCKSSGNTEWEKKHQDAVNYIVDNFLPSGSGFDSGTKLLPESTPERLVFQADFHPMDEHGGYLAWSYHKVIVTPSLVFGFNLRVTGGGVELKDFIADSFDSALGADHLRLMLRSAP